MVDVVAPEKRSRMMAGIRNKDTKPELLIRKGLHARGYRYKLHVSSLPGRPDLVFPRYKAVIFVNGCFWHGHMCDLFKWPSSHPDFWREKILSNVKRDLESTKSLESLGWRVLTVWECAVKGKHRITCNELLLRIEAWLEKNEGNNSIGARKPDQCS